MSVLGIIPARSGSKGLVDKNISTINGVSLLELAVRFGLDCRSIDDLYISTDSPEYESLAINAGASSAGLRPAHLSTDSAKTVDVVLHLLSTLTSSYEYIVLLQPTAPVRTPYDVLHAFNKLVACDADAIVSVEFLDEPHPEKIKKINSNGYITPYIINSSSEIPRQELPKCYRLNGAFYIIKVQALLQHSTFFPVKTLSYQMSKGVNIDSETDLLFLRFLHNLGKVCIHGLS